MKLEEFMNGIRSESPMYWYHHNPQKQSLFNAMLLPCYHIYASSEFPIMKSKLSSSSRNSQVVTHYLLFGAQFPNHPLAPSKFPPSASNAATHHSRS